jgi:hypothetical protein
VWVVFGFRGRAAGLPRVVDVSPPPPPPSRSVESDICLCWKHRHLEVNGDTDNRHTVLALFCVTALRDAVVLLQEVNGDVWGSRSGVAEESRLFSRDAVVGWIDVDIANDRTAFFVFMFRQSRKNTSLYLVLKMEALGSFETYGSLIQWHSIATQNILIFKN